MSYINIDKINHNTALKFSERQKTRFIIITLLFKHGQDKNVHHGILYFFYLKPGLKLNTQLNRFSDHSAVTLLRTDDQRIIISTRIK